MMSLAGRYLSIPRGYAAALDGLRWSSTGEAVETQSGETFAFAVQVWPFLEGLVAVRPPLHFAQVLHFMQILGCGPIGPVEGPLAELRRAFLLAGRPLRNAGGFCGHLCRDLPGTAFPLEPSELRQVLLHQSFDTNTPTEASPLTSDAFQQYVTRALERYAPLELLHWLKFGQARPSRTDDQIIEELLARPPHLLEALSRAAKDRERLAGALALVPTLNGAVTLPPRRLDQSELPLGGYADITTRGDPERLLPTQFALEGEEFVRRFAEHELLFFRREEPDQPANEELVVLLDQGVRTWGAVRLALAGAMFALARLAQRRGMPFRLATTGQRGEPVDPVTLDSDALGRMLEASDLSANPEEALRSLCGLPSERPRDIVLLTHPRSLPGAGGDRAAVTLAEDHRLFAISVDSEGHGQLVQFREGWSPPLSRFRLDLTAGDAPTPARSATTADETMWTGDVEPIPFPFWFGPLGHIHHLAFDATGDWFLACCDGGMLHLQSTDGTRHEVLPRGFVQGQVLHGISDILGTASGFVVCGDLVLGEASPRRTAVAVHYDLSRRVVRAHVPVPQVADQLLWYSFADLHSIAGRSPDGTWSIDLTTGAQHPDPGSSPDKSRAREAGQRARRMPVARPHVVLSGPGTDAGYYLQRSGGWIHLSGVEPPWEAGIPLSDGAPALENAVLRDVQFAGSILGIGLEQTGGNASRLLLLRGPSPKIVRELLIHPSRPLFRLSDDGTLVALKSRAHEISIFDVALGGPAKSIMAPGDVPGSFDVEFGPGGDSILVSFQTHQDCLTWASGELIHERRPPSPRTHRPRANVRRPALAGYDVRRFFDATAGKDWVVSDRKGQVILLDAAGSRLRAIFAFRHGKVAAWLPDGTRWGAPELGGPPTAGAAERVARALR